jgi:hypothetical protein
VPLDVFRAQVIKIVWNSQGQAAGFGSGGEQLPTCILIHPPNLWKCYFSLVLPRKRKVHDLNRRTGSSAFAEEDERESISLLVTVINGNGDKFYNQLKIIYNLIIICLFEVCDGNEK